MSGSLGKAALAGLAGGLAGAFAMSQFSRRWGRLVPQGSGSPRRSRVIPFAVRQRSGMGASRQEWDSTLNATVAVTRVLRMPLGAAQRERGAVAVHYTVGAALGGFYGVIREYFPDAAGAWGAAFGLTVWLVLEEGGMPLLGWTRPPLQYSLADHINALGEHVAYGVATEAVCRLLRRP
jgi:uncharacterized membrane protein YagU involved in acid resistance